MASHGQLTACICSLIWYHSICLTHRLFQTVFTCCRWGPRCVSWLLLHKNGSNSHIKQGVNLYMLSCKASLPVLSYAGWTVENMFLGLIIVNHLPRFASCLFWDTFLFQLSRHTIIHISLQRILWLMFMLSEAFMLMHKAISTRTEGETWMKQVIYYTSHIQPSGKDSPFEWFLSALSAEQPCLPW